MSIFKMLPISEIDSPRRDIRSQESAENMMELARSIGESGIINPLIVRKKGDRYELVAGFRRIRAAQMVGMSKVPVLITDLDDTKTETVKLIENLQREDMNPVDEGRAFHMLIQDDGLSLDQLAQKIGKSPAYISQRITLITRDEKVREAVEKGEISFTLAREIMAANTPEDRERYLRHAKEFGANPDTIRTWRRNDQKDRQFVGEEHPPTDLLIKPELPHVILYPCQYCEKQLDINKMAVIRLCPECVKALEEAKKQERQ